MSEKLNSIFIYKFVYDLRNFLYFGVTNIPPNTIPRETQGRVTLNEIVL